MSEYRDEGLNELLRRWADGRRVSEEHLDELCEATLHQVCSARFSDLNALPASSPWRRRRFGAASAVAAVALVAFWTTQRPRQPAGRPAGEVQTHATRPTASGTYIPAAARLDARQLAAKAELVKVLQETFPGDLVWVSETAGEIHIGLRSEEMGISGGEVASPAEFAVRIFVTTRRKHERTWTTLCKADVVTGAQELVEAPLDAAVPGRVAVWTCALPDGLVAVDTDLLLEGPRGLHSSSSLVQRAGDTCESDSSEVDDREYRVFQTIERLPGAAAGPPLDSRSPSRS